MKKIKKITGVLILVLFAIGCTNNLDNFEYTQTANKDKNNISNEFTTSTNGTGFLMPDPDGVTQGTKIKIQFSSNATVVTRALFRTTVGFQLGLQNYTICPNDANTELWTVTHIPASNLDQVMFQLVSSGIVDPTQFGEEKEKDDGVTGNDPYYYEFEKVSLRFFTTQTCD